MDAKILVLLAVLIAVQLTLQVVALVQLVKTPSERVSIGGRKWVWALIIVLGEMIGPIVWFVIGRTPDPVSDELRAAPDGRTLDSAADALYGKRSD